MDLHAKAQAAQLTNLAMEGEFIAAQRAAREYQATGDLRTLAEYGTGKSRFYASLGRLSRLATAGEASLVAAQGRLAELAFGAVDQANAATDAAQAAHNYADASAWSARFVVRSGALQARLARDSDVLAAEGGRTLGAGRGWVSAVLVFGLMVPVVGVAVFLRWVSGPLHDTTSMVRSRARGDLQIRMVPSGPADLRDLAQSMNFLSDETNRLREAGADRARLQAGVRQAA